MSPALTTAFGMHIRTLRKARGISQRDLAKQVGVHYTYFSKVEHADLPYSPSIVTLQRIAEVLEADENELIRLAGHVPDGLKSRLRDNPLLVELVRLLTEHRLPDETYRQMIDLAKRQEALRELTQFSQEIGLYDEEKSR